MGEFGHLMSPIRYDLVTGRTVSIVTISFFVLVSLATLGTLLLRYRTGSGPAGRPLFKALATPFIGVWILGVGGVSLACYLYAPRAFLIHSEGIIIDRMVSPILVAWDQVKTIREVTPEEFSGTIRVFGNGGLFGRVGTYRSKLLGNFRMYLTNEVDAVLIDANERYVISPHPAGGFVRDATRALTLYRDTRRPLQ
jgi:hypothetical protein